MAKLIPKHQRGKPMWQTESMPQYYDLKERIRKEDPALYNKQEQEYAAQQHPTSEFIIWKNSNGQIRRTPQVIGMSGADPIGQLYVEGAALNPVFKGLGRVAEYGLAKAGNKWARAKILSREINKSNTTINDVNNLSNNNFINKNTQFGKNSSKAIHADYGDNIAGFTKGTTGASIRNNKLIPGHNPNTDTDYIWWNMDKPYSTGIKGKPFTRYIVKDEKNIPGIINIREQSKPIGQWNGKSGFVLKSERVTPEQVPLNDASILEYNPITMVYENKIVHPAPAYFDKNNILASIYDNPDQYRGRISDRVIDFMKQRKEVGKSLKDSRDFIQSTAVKNSKETNQRIADRLGLPRQAEYDLQHKPVIYHYKFGQKNYNLKGVSPDNVGGYYDRTKKTINLRENYHNLQTAKSIPFHENLHAQGYGSSAVNDWKIQYLIDKDKVMNMSKRNKDYFLSSEELPVHTATLGESWGVKPGQSYPGDKAFDEMLYNDGIGGASYYLKYDTPKDKRRFWRTLNGTMFGLSPAIINKNTQPSN